MTTTDKPSDETSDETSESVFSLLNGHDYISLKTRKRSGETVPTPVWFVKDDSVLYVTTRSNAAKLKRIRNFNEVEIAPCDVRGKLLGDWIHARAQEITSLEVKQHVNRLFSEKYGHTDMWKKIEPADSPNRAFIRMTFATDTKYYDL